MAWIDDSTPITLFNDIMNNVRPEVTDKIGMIRKIPIQERTWQVWIQNRDIENCGLFTTTDLECVKNTFRRFDCQIIDGKNQGDILVLTVIGDSTMKDAENYKKDWDKYVKEQTSKK